MLNVKVEGNKAIMDVREMVLNGEHPKDQILDYVQNNPNVASIEIHLPLLGQPLVNLLNSTGMNATIEKLASEHYMITAERLS